MRLHLLPDTIPNAPYLDLTDRALGYHVEIARRVDTLAIPSARKDLAFAAAFVSGCGGDFRLIDPSLSGWAPALPTLREYLEGDDAAAYLTPRAELLLLLSPEQTRRASEHVSGLIEVSPGEGAASAGPSAQ